MSPPLIKTTLIFVPPLYSVKFWMPLAYVAFCNTFLFTKLSKKLKLMNFALSSNSTNASITISPNLINTTLGFFISRNYLEQIHFQNFYLLHKPKLKFISPSFSSPTSRPEISQTHQLKSKSLTLKPIFLDVTLHLSVLHHP